MAEHSPAPVKTHNLLIAGAYGVIGTGITDAALADPSWNVTTMGRRSPPAHHLLGRQAPTNLSVDLLDTQATTRAIAGLKGKTDLAFTAFVEGGSMAGSVDANMTITRTTLDALAARDVPMGNIVLMGGAKSYGFHLGSMKTPAKETDARLVAPIFYHQQEDMVAGWAVRHGATWSVLRPHMVCGPSINSSMNLVTGLAVFAAISKALGAPLRFPGSWGTWDALHTTMDAGMLGRASLWALRAKSARNQIFNIGNGDEFRWRHLWKTVADFYGIEIGEPQPMNLESQMKPFKGVWETLVAQHGSVPTSYQQIAAWDFLDACLNWEQDVVLSTIKIRQAGFAEAIDTHDRGGRENSDRSLSGFSA